MPEETFTFCGGILIWTITRVAPTQCESRACLEAAEWYAVPQGGLGMARSYHLCTTHGREFSGCDLPLTPAEPVHA